MGRPGKLTRDGFGFSMPVDAPLYPSPPYIYKDATLLVFKYETDADAAAALLPSGLELPDTPTAGLVFASYPWCNLGAYNEVVLYLDATFQGEPVQYAAYLYVTTDAAMAAGREMGGFPKKMAGIDIAFGEVYTGSMERPAGLPICSCVFRPERGPAPIGSGAKADVLNYVSLRVIPSPQRGAAPTVAELVKTRWVIDSGEAWAGTGSCRFTGASALDPLHKIAVVRPQSSTLIRGNLVVAANEDRLQFEVE